MLTKRNLGRGKVRVTFTMAPLEDVKQLYLVGDFNNWSITETPMPQAADGSWSVALTLAAGQSYEFRYFADGQIWYNDWAADRYAPNTFGSENSVVVAAVAQATAQPSEAPKEKSAPRKKAAKA